MKKKKGLRRSDILYHIIKGWRLIVLFTIIGATIGAVLIGAGYIRGEVSREYRINSSFAVITPKESEIDKKNNNISVSKSMTATAMYIVKSRKNMKAVVDRLNLRGVSAGDIAGNLSLSRQGETEVVEMTLLWRSEKEGLAIMQAINEVSSKSIADTLKAGSVSIINEPSASFIIGGSIGFSTMLYGAVFGLAAGVLLCVLRFLIAPTLINEDDVISLFGIDSLGAIPLDKRYSYTKPLMKTEISVMDDIKSAAHLLLSRLEAAGVNKLYVTSTTHVEGKTRLIADFALQFARLGKKTLLIDCNLADPRLGALFYDELKYEQTLNSLYRGDSDQLDAILHVNGCLDILPTVLEKNPESLNDPLLVELKRVMNGYDYVFIDAAPVGEDAEVLRLNEIADTALYIVRYDYARIDDIKRAMWRIAKSDIPVVGVVFNFTFSWRQAIINTPRRLNTALRRVEKRKKKDEKRRTAYKALKSEGKRVKLRKAAAPVEFPDDAQQANAEDAKKPPREE